MKVAILAARQGWHTDELCRALAERGHAGQVLPYDALVTHLGGARPAVTAAGEDLTRCAAVLARIIPAGSLEQIILRVDTLHALEERGIPVINPPRAIERTVDKLWTSAILERAGLRVPETVVCESFGAAVTAFQALGDVIVKPLFGSMGLGMVRVSDEAMVERRAPGWKTNLARGGQARAVTLAPEPMQLALAAAHAVGAEYAGVDLLPARDGTVYVVEVNGIPGWRGLQEATSIDVAGAIVEHLVERVARR